MTFSRGLSTGWLEGTNHPKLTHGKFGKKRGAFVGEVKKVGKGFVELNWTGKTDLASGDGIVFDAGEDRNLEQGGRVFHVDDGKVKFHEKHSKIDWKRVRVGQGVWKTDDPKLNAEVKALWKNVKLTPKKTALDLVVSGEAGKPLTVKCGEIEVVSEEILDIAQNRPLGEEVLVKQFSRLGETDYQLGSIKNLLVGDVIVPVSALNRLRRKLVTLLDEVGFGQSNVEDRVELVNTEERSQRDLMPDMGEEIETEPELSVFTRYPEQIEAALEAGVKRIYADFEDIRKYKDAVSLVRESGTESTIHLATPRIQKSGEAGYFKLIERAEADGVLIRNLGAIQYFKGNKDLYKTGDFSLNCANPITAKILKERGELDHLTISYDLNIGQVKDMLYNSPEDWFELTLHQHMPMFHMEHCVFCTFLSDGGTSIKDCGKPCDNHKVQLRDRVGQLHTLMADVGCRNTLFSGRAQTGARFYKELEGAGLSKFRIDMLRETKDEALMAIQAYQQLLDGKTDGHALWQDLDVMEKLGVTEGTFS